MDDLWVWHYKMVVTTIWVFLTLPVVALFCAKLAAVGWQLGMATYEAKKEEICGKDEETK